MSTGLKAKREVRRSSVYWVVSVGKKFTGGMRQRKYFRNRSEANLHIKEAEDARRKLGREAFILPLSLRAEALTCHRRLASLNFTLTQAVDYFLKYMSSSGTVVCFGDLQKEFLKSRKAMNCRERTLVQYKSYLRVFCAEFGKFDVSKLLPQDIEDWLEESDWSPRTRKNYLVTVTTLLNLAVRKGYRSDNPAARIERPILDDRPVGILSVAQVRTLLLHALESDRTMIPPLAIGLFAGLRRSEFFALDWSEIDLKSRVIEVKASKAKTRQRRLVHISDNLLEWLRPHAKVQGRVTSQSNIDVFSEVLRELAEESGIQPWPHNALRHSFGSYFLGKTKDENLTASEMGNSPRGGYQALSCARAE